MKEIIKRLDWVFIIPILIATLVFSCGEGGSKGTNVAYQKKLTHSYIQSCFDSSDQCQRTLDLPTCQAIFKGCIRAIVKEKK